MSLTDTYRGGRKGLGRRGVNSWGAPRGWKGFIPMLTPRLQSSVTTDKRPSLLSHKDLVKASAGVGAGLGVRGV